MFKFGKGPPANQFRGTINKALSLYTPLKDLVQSAYILTLITFLFDWPIKSFILENLEKWVKVNHLYQRFNGHYAFLFPSHISL